MTQRVDRIAEFQGRTADSKSDNRRGQPLISVSPTRPVSQPIADRRRPPHPFPCFL